MDEKEKENSKLKVEDKRRFDSLGNERSGDASSVQPPPVAEVEQKAVRHDSKPPKGDRPRRTDEITFTSFLMSLATQVLMQLGEMKPPPGVDLEKDLVGAKHTIDLLSLLQVKTAGNLDESEAKLLEEMLHNLRMTFVRVSQG